MPRTAPIGQPGFDLPESCQMCPRRCGANRRAGQSGYCGAADELLVARAALHEWEEPPISVGAGSGTVFFSNCPMRCIYCQNAQIACGAHGTAIDADRLVQIFWELRSQGAANINLVTPTHYLPFVLQAIDAVRNASQNERFSCPEPGTRDNGADFRTSHGHSPRSLARSAHEGGFDLPFVCNTSGYETVQTVRTLHGSIDVYLTDFKYAEDAESNAARRYSNAPDYFDVAWAALRAMVESAGAPRFDQWAFDAASEPEERLVGGVLVRHLMLSGRLEDSKRIMARLWAEYGTGVLYSVMNQYTPLRAFPEAPELESRVPDSEYECLLDYLDALGMPDYYWQEGGAAEASFIPAFDSTGVLP